MANESIVRIISEQLRSGFTIGDIKAHLLQYGYTEKDIDAAVASLLGGRQSQLAVYIREQMARGYSIVAIREYLLKHGYNQNDVEGAIASLTHPVHIRHEFHLSKNALVGVGAVCLVILAVAAIFFYKPLFPSSPVQPNELLDVGIEGVAATVVSGEPLPFTVTLSNMGANGRSDISLTYTLSDAGGKTVLTKQETIALETTASKRVVLQLPSDIGEGRYDLDVKAAYNGKTADAQQSLRVVAVTQEKKAPIPPEDEEAGQEQQPDKEVQTQQPEPIRAPTPDEKQAEVTDQFTRTQLIEKVRELATSDVTGTAVMCKKIERISYKYTCLAELALQANDFAYCLEIGDAERKDTCLMSYATTKKDYRTCDYVLDVYLKQSCISLAGFDQLQADNPSLQEATS